MDTTLSNLAHEFISALQNPTPLSTRATARTHLALDHAWADSTLISYYSMVACFHSFCDEESIPHHFRFPASKDLLCAFAASWIGLISGSTANSHIVALKAWHIYNNAPWLGGPCLRYVLHSMENLTPTQSRRPPHPLIMRKMLVFLASHLSPSDPFDVCCLAVATCTMWAQLCLRKILSQWETSFSPSRTVCRRHLLASFNQNRSCLCHLPFTKVKKSKGEDVCICCQSNTSDPFPPWTITSISTTLHKTSLYSHTACAEAGTASQKRNSSHVAMQSGSLQAYLPPLDTLSTSVAPQNFYYQAFHLTWSKPWAACPQTHSSATGAPLNSSPHFMQKMSTSLTLGSPISLLSPCLCYASH